MSISREVVGVEVGELIVPARMPIGGCAEDFEDALSATSAEWLTCSVSRGASATGVDIRV